MNGMVLHYHLDLRAYKLIILHRTPFIHTLTPRLLRHDLPRQLHQTLRQLLIPRHLTPGFNNRRRTNILPALLDRRRRKHRRNTALKLVLLERLQADGHGVAAL